MGVAKKTTRVRETERGRKEERQENGERVGVGCFRTLSLASIVLSSRPLAYKVSTANRLWLAFKQNDWGLPGACEGREVREDEDEEGTRFRGKGAVGEPLPLLLPLELR